MPRNTAKRDQARAHVVRHMVQNSVNKVFHGSPRPEMERRGISVSSGDFYRYLYGLGMKRKGQGDTAEWTIPANVIRQYTP